MKSSGLGYIHFACVEVREEIMSDKGNGVTEFAELVVARARLVRLLATGVPTKQLSMEDILGRLNSWASWYHRGTYSGLLKKNPFWGESVEGPSRYEEVSNRTPYEGSCFKDASQMLTVNMTNTEEERSGKKLSYMEFGPNLGSDGALKAINRLIEIGRVVSFSGMRCSFGGNSPVTPQDKNVCVCAVNFCETYGERELYRTKMNTMSNNIASVCCGDDDSQLAKFVSDKLVILNDVRLMMTGEANGEEIAKEDETFLNTFDDDLKPGSAQEPGHKHQRQCKFIMACIEHIEETHKGQELTPISNGIVAALREGRAVLIQAHACLGTNQLLHLLNSPEFDCHKELSEHGGVIFEFNPTAGPLFTKAGKMLSHGGTLSAGFDGAYVFNAKVLKEIHDDKSGRWEWHWCDNRTLLNMAKSGMGWAGPMYQFRGLYRIEPPPMVNTKIWKGPKYSEKGGDDEVVNLENIVNPKEEDSTAMQFFALWDKRYNEMVISATTWTPHKMENDDKQEWTTNQEMRETYFKALLKLMNPMAFHYGMPFKQFDDFDESTRRFFDEGVGLIDSSVVTFGQSVDNIKRNTLLDPSSDYTHLATHSWLCAKEDFPSLSWWNFFLGPIRIVKAIKQKDDSRLQHSFSFVLKKVNDAYCKVRGDLTEQDYFVSPTQADMRLIRIRRVELDSQSMLPYRRWHSKMMKEHYKVEKDDIVSYQYYQYVDKLDCETQKGEERKDEVYEALENSEKLHIFLEAEPKPLSEEEVDLEKIIEAYKELSERMGEDSPEKREYIRKFLVDKFQFVFWLSLDFACVEGMRGVKLKGALNEPDEGIGKEDPGYKQLVTLQALGREFKRLKLGGMPHIGKAYDSSKKPSVDYNESLDMYKVDDTQRIYVNGADNNKYLRLEIDKLTKKEIVKREKHFHTAKRTQQTITVTADIS